MTAWGEAPGNRLSVFNKGLKGRNKIWKVAARKPSCRPFRACRYWGTTEPGASPRAILCRAFSASISRRNQNREPENPVPGAGALIGFAASCRTQLPDLSTRSDRSRERVYRHGCLFRLVAFPVGDRSSRHSSSVCLAGSKGSNPTVQLQPTSLALAGPWTP